MRLSNDPERFLDPDSSFFCRRWHALRPHQIANLPKLIAALTSIWTESAPIALFCCRSELGLPPIT
jgi:hypothetical protein